MIDVAAAVIVDENNRIFIARKKRGLSLEGYWEFPGGKIESGETAAEAIERELMEEMNIKVRPGELLGENIHFYESFTVRLIAHYASITEGEIRLSDHDAFRWVSPAKLGEYEMAPADEPIKRIVQEDRGIFK